MIRLTLQILTGLVLCSCTVNNFHSTVTTSFDQRSTELYSTVETVREHGESSVKQNTTTIEGNPKIKPECEIYVPLPVPKPARIDFKELAAAETSKEINAIALRNVKELHLQINEYAVKQQRHYDEYLKRCITK